MILVDTNVFLEYLLDQSRAQDCGQLLARLSRGELEGVVTRFSLHSIEALCEPGVSSKFLANVDRSVGLYVRDTTTAEEAEAAALATRIGRDFDDAMQYFVAKHTGAEAIASFDSHFDGLDIRRVEPGQLLWK